MAAQCVSGKRCPKGFIKSKKALPCAPGMRPCAPKRERAVGPKRVAKGTQMKALVMETYHDLIASGGFKASDRGKAMKEAWAIVRDK